MCLRRRPKLTHLFYLTVQENYTIFKADSLHSLIAYIIISPDTFENKQKNV